MRRSLLLVCALVSLAAAAGTVALASSSPAAGAHRAAIVCPIATVAQPYCCPPLARAQCCAGARPALCCGRQAVECVIPLSIGATPNPSVAGQQVVISGRLVGSRSAGVDVTLWHRLPGQRRFGRLLDTLTDAAGQYRIVRGPGVVRTNREFYVTARVLRSATIRQR